MFRKYEKFKLSSINTTCNKDLKYQHNNHEPSSFLLQKHINLEQDKTHVLLIMLLS